ncbi:hypothetical protein, partial [Rheinheimera sp. NSM]|uniref:hypothetical protein n=1 Tax=Rheinheimera sp. NSM TaxID=3457884 RepID=UPI004036BBCA
PWHGAHYRAFLHCCKRLFAKNTLLPAVCLLNGLFACFSNKTTANKLRFMVAVYYLTAKIRLLYLIKAFR